MGIKKPEDNIGRSVGEDFKMEKTPAAHVSRSLLESSSCLEKIRQDACEGRKSKILEQLNLASAFLDFPPDRPAYEFDNQCNARRTWSFSCGL